jgi:glycosyltransferase involved in cell wall biosynthesis
MKVLYLCDEYPPCQHGGIGTVTQTLARAIAEKGHKVVVTGFYPFYRKAEEHENVNGVEVYRTFYGTGWKLKLSKHRTSGHLFNIKSDFEKYVTKIKRLVEEYKIDIIESADFIEAFRYSGPRIIQFPDFGVPFIVKLHGSYSVVNDYNDSNYGNENIYLKEKMLLNMATGLVAVSKSVLERTAAKFDISKKIDILNNGIFLDHIPKYNSGTNENCVIFAGTLDENKGIFSLIKAWEKVIEAVPSAVLSVYGKGSPASVKSINKLITDKIRESVKLKGFAKKEDLAAFYATSSCAVFPSYSETFGMAPIEAMAIGCPTIFTKRTSGPEIIVNGIEGLLVDPDNLDEIAGAIIYMLTNRSQAIKMGQNGINKVREKFDISIIADKHIAYYSVILNKKVPNKSY